jgi:hypothetical protein
VLKFSKACLLLVTFRLTIAFPAVAETHPDERLRLVVSVYNDADVPATVLVQAEQEAAKIFDRAGLDVIWQNCSLSPNHVGPDALVRPGERSSPGSEQESWPASNPAGLRPAGRVGAPAPTWFGLETSACATIEWPTQLAVRVVPGHSTSEVFGVAFLSADGEGCYSDVFFDQAMELHTSWNVGLSDILGTVIAHELGHLLLGSNSHASTGIMRSHWQGEELRRLSRGGLWFTNEQADRINRRLQAIRQQRSIQLAASTRSTF